MKLKKLNTNEILTLTISILAIVISIKSCDISQKANNISEKEYYDKYNNIWVGIYNKNEKTFKIKPTNESVILQRASAYFPDIISKNEWLIRPSGNILHLSMAESKIQDLIKNKYPVKKGFSQVLDQSRIPIIIESYYTVNGNNLYDKSIYMIEFMAVINENKLPSIHINALIFSNHLTKDTQIKKYLNNLWEKNENSFRPK